MGLHKCFQCADLLKYRGPRGLVGINMAAITQETYNNNLITSPRYYPEELQCFSTTYSPGVIWVTRENTPYSDFVINHFAVTRQVEWPSWSTALWRYDAQYGHALTRATFGTGFGAGAVVYDLMCYSPDEVIWWFGPHADAYHGGPLAISQLDFSPNEMMSIQITDWEGYLGKSLLGVEDFNVDFSGDRVFFRWMTNNQGQVSVYRLSTHEHIGDIFTPNATAGIVLCRDGWAYIRDVRDWVCVYDYNGVYFGAFRNPRREAFFGGGGGVANGWDQYYRRLLFLGAVANSTDGASRMRIKGYYPNPDPAFLTNIIPRNVPRAGRKTIVFAHLGGEGLEPLASRQALFTGDVLQTTATDNEGDAVAGTTPVAAGDLAVALTVQTDIPTPDAPEANETYAGRTLIVRMRAAVVGDNADNYYCPHVDPAHWWQRTSGSCPTHECPTHPTYTVPPERYIENPVTHLLPVCELNYCPAHPEQTGPLGAPCPIDGTPFVRHGIPLHVCGYTLVGLGNARHVDFAIESIAGAVGDVTVEYIVTSVWYEEAHVAGGGPTDYAAGWDSPFNPIFTDTFHSPGPYYGCCVIAIATDSTGNKGQSNLSLFSL